MINMEFKVYSLITNEDVTDEKAWFVDTDGDLYFMTNDIDMPLKAADAEYYYKLEIEVI